MVASHDHAPRPRGTGVLMLVLLGTLMGLLYLPLLYWLGWTTLHTQQLAGGALLVVIALLICVRDAVGKLRLQPEINNLGLGLLALGFFYLWLAGRARFWLLPLVLLSFCFTFAAVMSFLFGKEGAGWFMPALGAFFVFGVLVGLFPRLDWPLREIAARYAGGLMQSMDVPVKVVLAAGEPAKLLLAVKGHVFEVATECNGFGLLTSSLIVATILAFQYRLPGLSKLGLLALAVPVAIVCNFLRIVSICLVAPRTQLPYGFVHETLGLIFYVGALGLIWKMAGWQTTPKQVPPKISTDQP
ncbi:MAG TPA: exosortase/archaeosortase family protein [Verrucomicrobiae bacterium]|nr:exosortase/archaeosortase family protein [Verrucomicrobiae bacterium]